jgi:toxin ParE1/3/4
VKRKPVLRRLRADRDIESAFAYYLSEAGPDVAADFIDRFEEAIKQIEIHPAIGTPRYGHELHIPGLRHMPIRSFPYLIFFFETDKHIELARVLHGSMDIPSRLDDIE